MSKLKDLAGKSFGKLTVISFDRISKRQSYWTCRCYCGTIKSLQRSHLITGETTNCGCLNGNIQHGEAGIKTTTKEYRAWAEIKRRCYVKSNSRYSTYGARGVTMCDRWLNSYSQFLGDMGRAPSKNHSIDRINNDGNYEPSNCRWTTDVEQANNRSNNLIIAYNGETRSLAEWCRELSLPYGTIAARIYKWHWPAEIAFTKKIRQSKQLRLKQPHFVAT